MDDVQHIPLPDTTCITKNTEDKPSHDASIFVGSLPSNIDQGDLSRMLMDHLSEHTQIKNVKVVRDSKGGVCAFVQCLDANSATSLIETLYANPPKPFLGRILRYEPARAFRTLIISYRAPIHLCPVNYSSGSFKDQPTETELPTAMRIWKHCNSSILYNAQALQAEENRSRSGPLELEGAFFLHPVRYDEETLRNLAAYFGSLENFNPVEVPADGQYPIPHNGPRSSTMDSRCWEVKWQHRDECVSALMTLRKVPHLTVTWAHQPLSRSSFYQPQHHYVSGTPFRFRHQHGVPPEFMVSRVLAHPIGTDPCPEHINYQSVGQKFAVGRGIVHSSLGLANKQILKENLNTLYSKSFLQHRQAQNFASPLLENETLSTESDGQNHESRDLDTGDFVPQTPVLDASPVTIATPGSHFPITPATSGTSHGDFVIKEDGNFPRYGTDKQVDPTTLFVGGLELQGPGAWHEEKVRTVFSKYGGLENVKFVRPINATVAFAFLKFNNVESPARAVEQEHNRVYEGRALRVQLRDINPPKGNWRFGRGRGRFLQQNFNSHRRYNYRPFFNGQNPSVATHEDTLLETDIRQSALASFSETPQQRSKATSSTVDVNRETPGTEKFREWYDNLESPHTPAPSSKGSSTSITCASYTAPSHPLMYNGLQMPPPSWMQPCGPYPLPYYPGYACYPPPTIPQQLPAMVTPTNPDANGPTMGSLAVWPSGVCGSFVSYPIGPLRVPPVGQVSQNHGSTQAPLVPSGFIQNEHGTLIAVYQQEALNRYMAGELYHPEGVQPSTTQHVSHQGQIGVNTALHRAPGVQISYYEGTQRGNEVPHRRPQNHQSYVGRNQLGNGGTFARPYTGKSGRGYVQNTYRGRGGHAGRTSDDWNR